MHLDLLDLRNFYHRSALGSAAREAVRERLLTLWPNARGETVAGFGFAVPLLRPYLGQARRVIALMPGRQGVMSWPAGMPNVATLCEETRWPLGTGTVDKLVLLHGLETSERPDVLLDECWRVLGPGGRAMFIVPNRAGLWSRNDRTPFGHGRPYSMTQLENQLKAHDFTPGRHVSALFLPPSERQFWLRSAQFWERNGRRISVFRAGGVLMAEASKQLFQPRRPEALERVRKPLRMLEGLAQPGAKPV